MQLIDIMDRLDSIIEKLDQEDDGKEIPAYVDMLRDLNGELLDHYNEYKHIFKRKQYDSH